jgi:hypothetical protein
VRVCASCRLPVVRLVRAPGSERLWVVGMLTGSWLVSSLRRVARRPRPAGSASPARGASPRRVKGEVAAAMPGGASGDGDQAPADGRDPGLREVRAG